MDVDRIRRGDPVGLVAYLRELGAARTALGARVIADLERMWPADLADDLAPYDEPDVRELLAPAWLALARDVARPEPRLVTEVGWHALDRGWRIHWIAQLIRLSRAWTGTDLTEELAPGWPADERALLATHLAEAASSRAWKRFLDAPTPEHRSALESALDAQCEHARAAGPSIGTAILERHARTRTRADEIVASRAR